MLRLQYIVKNNRFIRRKSMKEIIGVIIEVVTVSVTFYILFIAFISFIKTLLYIFKNKIEWKDRFREVFLDIFYDIVNPFNWF